jgi:hypothetical protein
MAIPGDDSQTSTRWSDTQNGDGDGYIDGFWQTDECKHALDHLRRAGLISVPGTVPNITLATPWSTPAILCSPYNFTSAYASASVVYRWMPQGVQAALDAMYDDGVWNSGAIRTDSNPGPSEFISSSVTRSVWTTWAF